MAIMAPLFLLCLLFLVGVAHGFAVVRHDAHYNYNRKSNTALHLELPVDPLVLAAGGLAVVGGLGTVLLTSRIRDMDATETNGASTSAAAAVTPTTPDTTTTATPTPTPTPATTASTATTVDLSIPYDAAAKLAYEKAGSPGDYATFKTKYEADAVADVKAKQK